MKKKTFNWDENSGMLGWVADVGENGLTYRNSYYRSDIVGMLPFPFSDRDKEHKERLTVTSPSFCQPSSISFKQQGGTSSTKNADAEEYLGVVLLRDGVVVKQ